MTYRIELNNLYEDYVHLKKKYSGIHMVHR